MKAEHVPQIAQIEALCFTDPWSEEAIAPELNNPLSLWLVALDGQRVVGYVGSQSVMGEADMMNIAVRLEYRRWGIAQRLICGLVSELKARQVHCLSLEVRASNLEAQALYEKLDFVQVGCRPNYYRNPREDALILRKEWAL